MDPARGSAMLRKISQGSGVTTTITASVALEKSVIPAPRAPLGIAALKTGLLVGALTLSGCAATPSNTSSEDAQAVALNLPTPSQMLNCDCEAQALVDENYFDRGVRALAARDYSAAADYFQRHKTLETAQAAREADLGLAFVTLLSKSNDVDAMPAAEGVDERAEVMILALAAVRTLEGQLDALEALNQALTKDLEKREDALKRLRDLTLGQQADGR